MRSLHSTHTYVMFATEVTKGKRDALGALSPPSTPMTQLSTVWLSALLGLFAGVGHGIVAHHAELPVSLVEQATDLVVTEPQSQFF